MGIKLTSRQEIEEIFSVDGVTNHLDTDSEFMSEQILNTIIERATQRCLLYLRTHYREEDLENNVWVREQATYIACYHLSIRAGNPSLYTDAYMSALMELEQVRDGLLDAGIPSKARGYVQTQILDSRFYESKRVNPAASTRVLPNQRVPRYPFSEP